jgi:hypothetical protein
VYEDCTLITGGTVIDAIGADPRPVEEHYGIGVLETEPALLEQLAPHYPAGEPLLSRSAG